MASVEVYDIGSESFSVRLTGLMTADADGTVIEYRRMCKWIAYDRIDGTLTNADYSTFIEPGNTQGGDYLFSGMIPGHKYQVQCLVYNLNTLDLIATVISDTFYTESESSGGGEETPTWVLHEISREFLNRTEPFEVFTTLGKRYTLYRITFSCAYDGEVTIYSKSNIDTVGYLTTHTNWVNVFNAPYPPVITDDDSGADANFSITSTVKAGTVYYVWFRGQNGTEIGYDVTIRINPPEEPAQMEKPAKWDWTTSNGSATDEQTKAAYKAVKNKESTLNFNHSVWDDMVDKVKEILDYSGETWLAQSSGGYATYANTKLKKGGYLYPVYFNSLRFNIGSRYSTGIEEQVSGAPVRGWYFLRLAECINAWIDLLSDTS